MNNNNLALINPYGGVKISKKHNLIGDNSIVIDNIYVLGG